MLCQPSVSHTDSGEAALAAEATTVNAGQSQELFVCRQVDPVSRVYLAEVYQRTAFENGGGQAGAQGIQQLQEAQPKER
jgi:hypothetical protein